MNKSLLFFTYTLKFTALYYLGIVFLNLIYFSLGYIGIINRNPNSDPIFIIVIPIVFFAPVLFSILVWKKRVNTIWKILLPIIIVLVLAGVSYFTIVIMMNLLPGDDAYNCHNCLNESEISSAIYYQ